MTLSCFRILMLLPYDKFKLKYYNPKLLYDYKYTTCFTFVYLRL